METWEKAKVFLEYFKFFKPVIKLIIALFAVYGGTMAYQMAPKVEAMEAKIDTAIKNPKVVLKQVKHHHLTPKEIQPIVDQAIATYECEHKIQCKR